MYVNLAYDTDFIIIEIIRIFKQKKKKNRLIKINFGFISNAIICV